MRDKAIIYINSRNRLSGTDSNFNIYLPIDTSMKYDHVTLLQANIPKTYYQVNTGYNTFTLVENTSQVTITVPIRTYNRQLFATIIANLLTANSPNALTYQISYSNTNIEPETGLFTYTVSGGTIQPSLIFPASSLLYEQMGFAYASTNTFSSGELTSTAVCNFASETSLFIRSDVCFNYYSQDNVLQEIYVGGVSYNSVIAFQNVCSIDYSKKVVKTGNVFNFSLTDENGNILDLNGVNMVFTILFYRNSPTEKLLEHYIRLKANKNDYSDDST